MREEASSYSWKVIKTKGKTPKPATHEYSRPAGQKQATRKAPNRAEMWRREIRLVKTNLNSKSWPINGL